MFPGERGGMRDVMLDCGEGRSCREVQRVLVKSG